MDHFIVVESLQPHCHSPVKMYTFNSLEEAEDFAVRVSKFSSRVYGVSPAIENNLRAYYLLRVFKKHLLTFEEVNLGKFN